MLYQDAFYDDGQAMANAEAAERKRSGPDKSLGNLTAMFDHYAGMSITLLHARLLRIPTESIINILLLHIQQEKGQKKWISTQQQHGVMI